VNMTPTTISRTIDEILPKIRARREEIEKSRRLPRDLADDLCRTRLFALSVPRAIGGEEAGPLDLMRAIETIATADGSTGWCAMIGLGNNVAAGYLPESGAREVFADPTAPMAGIAAPAGAATRVDGGVRVSGRWPFASGITHASWLWAGCIVMEGGKPRMTPHGPDILHVCMPVGDVEVHDTWYVSGLCGTGSNDFSATDVFIPEHRTFRLLDPAGHRMEPLYQVPPLPLFVFQVACVGLGIARAALDELHAPAQTKVPTLYSSVLADKAVAHVEVARAEVALRSARALLFDTVEEIWDGVTRGDAPDGRLTALGRAAATHAAETGAEVTRTVSRLAGGTAIYSSSSFQRHARDAGAVAQHFTMSPHTWEEAGRVFLGREPIVPVF
jgi:indole-3-acetate monooxygenase